VALLLEWSARDGWRDGLLLLGLREWREGLWLICRLLRGARLLCAWLLLLRLVKRLERCKAGALERLGLARLRLAERLHLNTRLSW